MLKRRILVTTPRLDQPGGVAALFNTLNLRSNRNIHYFEVQQEGNVFRKLISFVLLVPRFIGNLFRADLVHFNPSFNRNSFLRDSFLLLIARVLRKKIFVYWHGWDNHFFYKVKSNPVYRRIYYLGFCKADLIFVLGDLFRKSLIDLGTNDSKIQLVGNAAESSGSEIKIRQVEVLKILFLSRIEKGKGLDLVLRTISILGRSMRVHLDVAGDGSMLSEIKEMARNLGLENVVFHGHVEGEVKWNLLNECHLLFQPSQSEGMPLALIEAMFNALMIAAKPVGGIPDWINGEHAILLTSDDANMWAEAIKLRFSDQGKWLEDVHYQHKFAFENLTIDSLRSRLYKVYAYE